jgi:hypothetical protein
LAKVLDAEADELLILAEKVPTGSGSGCWYV